MKKILVLVRETFPTNEILTDKNVREKRVLNPYDEYALFQAKKIKEKTETEITCLFLSYRESQYGLRTALALGADRGIFVYYPGNSIPEIAKILAKEIKKVEYDAIFMGIRDVNNDREELPSRLAFALETELYPHILSVDVKEHFTVRREREEMIDSLEILESGIFAFSQNVYEPEYPSIQSIMGIREKEVQEVYYSDGMVEKNVTVEYQDIHRKQEVYKKISAAVGTEQLMEYMKKWKLVD
ncbi:electron transfer flavoprotein [Fusobacterium necrophorum]|uniref:electron transfer flavoprotein n=1 Tax=Fusobacterium necrophorum TaxID=859 RepID=UPI002550C001|nr:electron transfer flavoprotein [Fusobacterium necrophorum]MDK4501424.1 electron transfer flavoprotein [Fusobacterium necrophorum]